MHTKENLASQANEPGLTSFFLLFLILMLTLRDYYWYCVMFTAVVPRRDCCAARLTTLDALLPSTAKGRTWLCREFPNTRRGYKKELVQRIEHPGRNLTPHSLTLQHLCSSHSTRILSYSIFFYLFLSLSLTPRLMFKLSLFNFQGVDNLHVLWRPSIISLSVTRTSCNWWRKRITM